MRDLLIKSVLLHTHARIHTHTCAASTTDHFRSRWNNLKSDVRKAESGSMENVKQKFFQSHFLRCDHQAFLKGVKFLLLLRSIAACIGIFK